MIGKKINQLATELAPTTTDLTIIGDPVTGVSKKITLEQLGAIFGGAVSFYTTLGDFPVTGVIDIIYCAKDTKKLYLWSGSAYVEVFPSQSLLDTYQLRSEKGVSNGYASLDVNGKVPIGQLPNSIMEYKGTWNAATNTPTLANGTGDTGDVYICNAAGTVNFGAGPITFAVGAYVVYSGTIWQRSSGAVGTVTSVAVSRSGDALAITGSPITTSGTINIGFAGNSTQYINGAGNLVTFPGVINEAQNLITEVYNKTGATLTKGTIVYINGGQGNLPTVTKALATGDSTSAQTYGIVRNDITNNNNGYVVVAGRISDLDTQAYTEGTQLYLSPTTAGTFTSTKPYAPQHLVYVGIVVRAHPTQGVIEVKIQNGYELDELHNVAAQSPDNNDILQSKTATSLWTKVAGTTTNIAEGTNLYYTDARSRAALSFTAGSGAYNSTTGVITIPTNTNQLTNGAAFITLASLSAGAGISYNNTTGVIASTITQYTDALARTAISLTTTGTSGAATYNNTTGVLNIPQYQTALTNPVTGTGTTNYLPKFTGTSTIGNSAVFENGGLVGIGTNNPLVNLQVETTGTSTSIGGNVIATFRSQAAGRASTIQFSDFTNSNYISSLSGSLGFGSAGTLLMTLNASGNLGLGVTPSAWQSGRRALQIGTYTSLHDVAGFTILGNNTYNPSINTYLNNGAASQYYQQGGAHIWEQAPSGTAGNAISFTQAMTLNASGNLSVGNTNDTFKLDVSGTGRFTGALTGASATFSGDVIRTSSNVGNINEIAVVNTATSGASSSRVRIQTAFTGGTTLGDAITQYTDNNNFNWCTGSGVTTSRDYVIANHFTLGTSVVLRLAASTGAATFSSSVTAGGKFEASFSNTNTSFDNSSYLRLVNTGTSTLNQRVDLIMRWADGTYNGTGGISMIRESATARSGKLILQPIGSDGNNVEALTIASTGAATFSSTTNRMLLVNSTNATGPYLTLQSSGTDDFYIGKSNAIAGGNGFYDIYANANGGGLRFYTNGNGTSALTLSTTNAATFSSTIQTGAPANGTAQPWKLGNAVSGTVSPSHYLVVEINGQSYTINAFNGFP